MVAKNARGLKGKLCLGVYGGGVCSRSRDGRGFPILLKEACRTCGEQRCKAHCRCGRRGIVKARCGPRGVVQVDVPKPKAKAKAKAEVQANAEVQSQAPVGRAPGPSCEDLEVGDWYEQMVESIRTAGEVELASYIYDHPRVHDMLVKRLRGRADFKLNVYVDSEGFYAQPKLSQHQRSRVAELRAAGANVYLCRGPGRLGRFHCKAVVVDRRYMFVGSANITAKSESNDEDCYKVAGPSVTRKLKKLAAKRAKVPVWDGK